MRFFTISARFGHQSVMFCLDNARLRSRYKKKHIFYLDCYFPSILVSSASELASQDEIFHHICAVWSSVCNVLFRQCPFTQQISKTAYFLSRLLVSVVIGLVCSWVGVAGWDFPPYLRGLVISLQCFFSTLPDYAADFRNSIFFV